MFKGFAVLTARNDVLPNLLYVLLSDVVISNKMMVGAHYPALRVDQVAEIKIPLPPIEEQRGTVFCLKKMRIKEIRRLKKISKEGTEEVIQVALENVFKRVEEGPTF
ncbi:MAG: restriction endonuclease subunit S [Archaeoglobaceae archaeon]|nr:restriction endonuclease subunit S [Archaeoglobaceae archaeon]